MENIKNVIYVVKNEERKCFYVGYSSKSLSIRKGQHKWSCFKTEKNNKFYNFIRKYGWNSFTWQILAIYSSKEELPPAEIDWLAEQKKEYPDWECLNSTDGGEGFLNLSTEVLEKFSKINKGKTFSAEWKRNLSLSHLGHKLKPETIEKMKGRVPWNKGKKCPEISGNNSPSKRIEVRMKISKALMGRKRPEISKALMGRKRPEMTGKNNPMSRENKEKRKNIQEKI